MKTFLPDLLRRRGELGLQTPTSLSFGRDSLAHHQSQAAELKQVADNKEEGIEYLFTLGRASRKEDY